MTWTEPTRCELCGWTNRHDIRVSLVHWRDAAPGMAYEHLARCVDRGECKQRVADQGDTWPLVESANERRSA